MYEHELVLLFLVNFYKNDGNKTKEIIEKKNEIEREYRIEVKRVNDREKSII